MYEHPLGELPDLDVLMSVGPSEIDRARLVLLAGEVALADGLMSWLEDGAPRLLEPANESLSDDEGVPLRLMLAAAEVTGDWAGLVSNARTRTVSRDLAALVLARRARYLATHGDFTDADATWSEAVEQGCLAGLNIDAADWIYSRRQLAMRYTVFAEDVWHPIAAALNALPTRPRVAAAASPVRERALEAMLRGRLRDAALRLRRQLRDELVSGSWQGKRDARELLADVYRAAGEAALAARHLVLAGGPTRPKSLAPRQVICTSTYASTSTSRGTGPGRVRLALSRPKPTCSLTSM
jgi:hypothetical protein